MSMSVYKLLKERYDLAAEQATIDGPGWEHRDTACDEAWDDLIDYVEENDLSCTVVDPRRPRTAP